MWTVEQSFLLLILPIMKGSHAGEVQRSNHEPKSFFSSLDKGKEIMENTALLNLSRKQPKATNTRLAASTAWAVTGWKEAVRSARLFVCTLELLFPSQPTTPLFPYTLVSIKQILIGNAGLRR